METCCQKSNHSGQRQSWVITVVLLPVRFYRFFISPLLGPRCRFEPSCSHYAEQAIVEHGIVRGAVLSLKRLSKCHPWHQGGYDPVPDSTK